MAAAVMTYRDDTNCRLENRSGSWPTEHGLSGEKHDMICAIDVQMQCVCVCEMTYCLSVNTAITTFVKCCGNCTPKRCRHRV